MNSVMPTGECADSLSDGGEGTLYPAAELSTPSRMRVTRIRGARGSLPNPAPEYASLCIVTSGQLEDTSTGLKEILSEGDVLFSGIGTSRSGIVSRKTFQAILVDLPPEIVEQFCSMYEDNPRRIVTSATLLNGIPNRLLSELERNDAATPIAVEALLMQMMAEGSRVNQSETRPGWFREALQYIECTTDHCVTSGEIAQIVGTSDRRVREAFRRFAGKRVSELSREARVKAATERLWSDTPICDIAAELGFYDQSHLTRIFRRVAATTPQQFRARLIQPPAPSRKR